MTLILCAMKLEAKPFLDALECVRIDKRAVLKVYQGELAGSKVMVSCCGVGAVRAASTVQSLVDYFDISRVIMSGTACGIAPDLGIGDTVISEESLFHERLKEFKTTCGTENTEMCINADSTLLEYAKALIEKKPFDHPVYFGRISTGKSFVSGKNRDLIAKNYHPLCADMETAAVAEVCFASNISFIAVRSISDNEVNSGIGAFLRYAALAAKRSFIVVRELLVELKNAEDQAGC